MIDMTPVSPLPEVLAYAEHLPTLPTVAIEILNLSRNEKASIRDLAAIIAVDPALTAKILKLANSAAFRRRSKVTSVERAALILGMKTVQFLALSFSLASGSRRYRADDSFDYLTYWRYSVTMAVASQELARLIKSPYQQEAFLCGLLGHFGQLVMAQAMPQQYAAVLTQTRDPLPAAALESSVLGFNHHQVGATLLHAWEFPALVTQTIRFWETPMALTSGMDKAAPALCHLVEIADVTSQMVWIIPKEQALKKLHDYGYRYFGAAAVEMDAYFIGLEAKLAETAPLFDIEVAGLGDFQTILDEARDQLVRLSLGTLQALESTTERAQNLERENQYLATLAQTDKLTGLRNRAGFDVALEQVINARLHGGNDTALGLLVVDIDHFKVFNDTYGHLVGDEVLRHVAEWIDAGMRHTDIVARYGGEEFVVLMPHTTLDVLHQIAERIRSCVATGKVISQEQRLGVTVSVGGACVQQVRNPQDGLVLLKLADQCLYEAKAGGRNRTICREVDDLSKFRPASSRDA